MPCTRSEERSEAGLVHVAAFISFAMRQILPGPGTHRERQNTLFLLLVELIEATISTSSRSCK